MERLKFFLTSLFVNNCGLVSYVALISDSKSNFVLSSMCFYTMNVVFQEGEKNPIPEESQILFNLTNTKTESVECVWRNG